MLGFRGWDGLDDAEELLRISNIGHALFAISGGHFQTVTIRHDFILLLLEAFLQFTPIGTGIDAINKAITSTIANRHFSVPHSLRGGLVFLRRGR